MSFHRPLPPRPGQHRRPARLQILAGLVAVAAVVLALGGYAVLRMHQGAAVRARQDAASVRCASAAGQAAARCRSARPGGAGGESSGPSSGPSRHTRRARAGAPGRRRIRSARPHPTRSASTHSAPPPSASSSPTATPSPPPSSPPASDGAAAAQVLALINSARAQAGLPAYTISSGLNLSARRHTAAMAGGCGLSHQCPGEAALGDRLTAAGVSWTAAGENIGEGGPEPATGAAIAHLAVSLTQDMLDERPPDDGHRRSILSSSFHHVGICVFRDTSGTVWMTQDFSS